jgi:cation diffusion facilitator family transporter
MDRPDDSAHRTDAHRAVVVSAVGLALTGSVELTLAVLTHSVGLLGDALHNLSDVSTSALVFVGFRVSKRPPTRAFPYGYERAEDVAGLGIAVVIWLSAGFAGVESYRKLVGHGATTHLGLGMVGAVFGIIGNQAVARYKGRIGRRISSATLIADAQHSWLDSVSSLGALLGLLIVALGYRWGDPLAGLSVTIFIAHIGYEVTRHLAARLMDGVDPAILERVEKAAATISGVSDVTAKARWSGRALRVDINALLGSETSLEDALHTGRHVELAVQQSVPEVTEVRVFATT